ncbi:MAG: phytanoyl-CoA dioxygenase family protein [Mariniblastus sp.]
MSKVTRWAKRVQHSTSETLGDLRSFAAGYRHFKKNGVTPPEAYTSMRRLYRKTNGRFNDALGGLCKALHRKRSANLQESLFENVSQDEVKDAAAAIRRDGFFVFQRTLPQSLCQSLIDYSLSNPGTPTAPKTDASNGSKNPTGKTIFDRSNPQAIRHQFQADDLFQNETVQQLATDPYFFSIAQDYLGFNPVFDVLAMWWSAPTKDQQLQSRAAQLYHFDMDRLKFVKFFVYLTDVETDNGPHCYVRGSHKRKPAALLKDDRLSDDEILEHYSAEDMVELTGKTGTMLAVDTRGLHKGKPLEARDRLIFQIQFADSLFGQNYPLIHIPSGLPAPMAKRISSNRRCFANFSET